MSTKHLVAWAATFVVMLAIDAFWLGVVARSYYAQAMGSLMSPQPRLGFAAAFYLLYPIGLVIFAVLPSPTPGRAALLGALFGFFAYCTYDLTNASVVRGWPIGLTFIDIAWGTFVSGLSAVAGMLALRWFAAR